MSLFINYIELIENNEIKQITNKNTLKVEDDKLGNSLSVNIRICIVLIKK